MWLTAAFLIALMECSQAEAQSLVGKTVHATIVGPQSNIPIHIYISRNNEIFDYETNQGESVAKQGGFATKNGGVTKHPDGATVTTSFSGNTITELARTRDGWTKMSLTVRGDNDCSLSWSSSSPEQAAKARATMSVTSCRITQGPMQ